MARKRIVNTPIELLREEVIRKHKAASAKVSRLRRRGVELAGSEYDVRREISRVKAYNMAQLNKYLYELTGFTDRKTQFVASSEGRPVRKDRVAYYQELENRFNLKGEANLAKIGSVEIVSSGQTISEREAMLAGYKGKRASGAGSNKPFWASTRKIENIRGSVALENLIKDMERKLSPKYLAKSVKKTQGNINSLIDAAGVSYLREDLDKLTLNQKHILYHHTNFAGMLTQLYGHHQIDPHGKYSEASDALEVEISKMVEDAKELPKR